MPVSKGESALRRAARVPDQVRSARLTHPRAGYDDMVEDVDADQFYRLV